MSAGSVSTAKNKKKAPLSSGDLLLLIPAAVLVLFGILVFAWYGATFIPVRQDSQILPREVEISSGGISCTLDIPAGTLSLTHPSRAALGGSYKTEAGQHLQGGIHRSVLPGNRQQQARLPGKDH